MSSLKSVRLWRWVICIAVALAVLAPGCAPSKPVVKEIKIGLVVPLTGGTARVGAEFVTAHTLAMDIVNKKYDLNLPLAREEGLPNLGGAKLVLVTADSQGNPEVGYAETERLISQEKPAVIIGAYQSAVTKTASRAAEREGVPFVNDTSTSPALTTRGFNWFFRVSPHDGMFAADAFAFFQELNAKQPGTVKRIGLFNEDSEAGAEMTKLTRSLVTQNGFEVAVDITYHSGTTDLTSEVLKLKSANPDAIVSTAYDPDVILLWRTFKEQKYAPKIVVGMRGGWSSPNVRTNLGADFEYACTTNVWAVDLAAKNPLLKAVNDLFVERAGFNMSAESARAITTMLVVADAINRAGSTAPDDIRRSLEKTNIPPDQLIVPWTGVKFDSETHQNMLGKGIITQIRKGEFVTVWPFDMAAADFVFPIPQWDKR